LAGFGGYGTNASPLFNNILSNASPANTGAFAPSGGALANLYKPVSNATLGGGSGSSGSSGLTFSFTPLDPMQGSVLGNLSGSNRSGSQSMFSGNLSGGLFSSTGAGSLGNGFTPLSSGSGFFSRTISSPASPQTPFTSMFGTSGSSFLAGKPTSGNSGITVVYPNVVVNNGSGFVNVVKNDKTGAYGVQTSKGIDWNNPSIAPQVKRMDFDLRNGYRLTDQAGTAKDVVPTYSQVQPQLLMRQLLQRQPGQAGVTKDIPPPFLNNQIQNAFPR
jgi:hypothetical protein